LIFSLLGILFVLLFVADILLGSIIIPVKEVFHSLFSTSETNETYRTIILSFRLPKALTAIMTGAALSLSGLQMQTVFRNPLAGPYVLGISAGASLGVALFVLGFSSVLAAGVFTTTGAWPLGIGGLGGFVSGYAAGAFRFHESKRHHDHSHSRHSFYQCRFRHCEHFAVFQQRIDAESIYCVDHG